MLVAGVLAHMGGIDETAIVWVPLIMVGLWWLLRGGDPKEDEPPGKELP